MDPKDIKVNQTPEKLIVTSSPHVHDTESVEKIMWIVNLTLLPAAVFSVINFGLPALFTMLMCIIGSVACEAAIQYWRKMEITVKDEALCLQAFCWPCVCHRLSMVYSGYRFSGCHRYRQAHNGGLGHNVFNPAHIGRAFVMAQLPCCNDKHGL